MCAQDDHSEDNRNKAAAIVLAVAAVLIGLVTWLSGRKGFRDAFTAESIREAFNEKKKE